MRTREALRESTDPKWIRIAGMVRRMAVTLTSKVLWQLVGVPLPDDEGGATEREVINAEAFIGFGFFARPPSSGKPEAIILSVGDADAPMIIAVRDEKTRAAIVGALKLGETAIYTDQALVYLKDNGTIEARSAAGAAAALATKADMDALKSAIQGWTPVPNDGGAALKTALLALFSGPPTWPAGTKKFNAE
jgi:hypothetical protein